MPASIDIQQALRDRLESDRLLGAADLPVRLPQRAPRLASNATAGSAAPAAPAPAALPPRVVSDDEKSQRRIQLNTLDCDEVQGCTKCALSSTRTKTVFGVGDPAARILFVGEAPGHDEDRQGEPFVGRAGRLLTDMIEKGMGLRREDVYICNVLKCRPPDNRTPVPDEITACSGYLMRQIEIIQPQVIVALGAPAAQTLLNTREGIGRLRSRFHEFRLKGADHAAAPIPLMPTYHPAYLLRSPGEKKKTWTDLKMVMAHLGIPLPSRP